MSSFIQPCFIRKNTPELRKKLEELGYNQHPCYGDNGQYLYLNRGFYHTNVVGYSEEIERMIDCRENEALFLALAALRDNSDRNQWFIYDKDTSFLQKGDWYMCSLNHHLSPSHKATVEELIEHFKN